MPKVISVLHVSYEVAPFYKRGGLGDVLGSLPVALLDIGINIQVVMPYYRVVQDKGIRNRVGEFSVVYQGRKERISIYESYLPKGRVKIWFLGNTRRILEINLKRKKIGQFAFFDLAVVGFVDWLKSNGVFPLQIVHCHDWHTGLIPLLIKFRLFEPIATLFTIHNHKYQGKGPEYIFSWLGIENHQDTGEVGKLNSLLEGVVHADAVSTVSPAYAKELKQSFKLLTQALGRKSIAGIVNGIDEDVWNPAKDRYLNKQYTVRSAKEGKGANKDFLLKRLRLEDRPTFSFIGRMASQKGLDLLLSAAPDILKQRVNIILLGMGNQAIENRLETFQKKFPDSVRFINKYDETMAHWLYAGSDFIIIPSHYEPCGLVQMIGMRYGSIPIASKTGGLQDTIDDRKTGFLFRRDSLEDLVSATKLALTIYNNQTSFHAFRQRCMKKDFSWVKSAKEYKKLYISLLS